MSDNFRSVYEWVRTEDEAKAAAKAKAGRIERSKRRVELSMPGRLDIVAGAFVTLSGFREGVDGRIKVVTVKHSITRSGWLTSITGEGA
jgi:phage protein D